MGVWGMGMRMRVFCDALWALLLGSVLLLQSPARNAALHDRLHPQQWTPHMIGWVMLGIAVLKLLAVFSNRIPAAAITEGAACLVFCVLTWAVWPPGGHSYGFPIFTGYVAMSQALSLIIMARDGGRA